MKKKLLSAIIISALVVSLASCSNGGTSTSPSTGAPSTGAPSIAADAADGKADYSPKPSPSGEGTYAAATEAAGAEMPAATTVAPSAYDDSYLAGEYDWAEDYSLKDVDVSRERTQARAGLLTGGEWRDNTNYAYWRSLFAQRKEWQDISAEWQLDTLERIVVRVTGAGKPAAGLTVKLASGNTLLWETVTDSRGEAFLFTGINTLDQRYNPDKIIVETADGKAVTADVPKDFKETDTAVEITIPDSAPMRTDLDLMFVIDTTGSMSDELRYLQTELASVIDRVANNTGVETRLSVNFYRDVGDDYVVRDFGFTKNISIAIDHLEDQRSTGGGDYPEAVTKALKNAIADHDWADKSEKLMFLVLDAPPHLEDALAELENLIRAAAVKGIRIIPVASSGVDTQTEFLCRTMSIATGGTYTFLTDDSGIGNSHLEPTVGSYTVEKLNDMLVRIITDYFSQEPRSYNTQAPASNQQQDQNNEQPGYPAEYFYSSAYFEGEGMYTTGLIRSEEELEDFRGKYNFNVDDSYYDFDNNVIAYKVDLLSSGSITVDESKDIYCSINEGKPVFHYSLDVPEVGTADIKTLFLFSEIPADELGQ